MAEIGDQARAEGAADKPSSDDQPTRGRRAQLRRSLREMSLGEQLEAVRPVPSAKVVQSKAAAKSRAHRVRPSATRTVTTPGSASANPPVMGTTPFDSEGWEEVRRLADMLTEIAQLAQAGGRKVFKQCLQQLISLRSKLAVAQAEYSDDELAVAGLREVRRRAANVYRAIRAEMENERQTATGFQNMDQKASQLYDIMSSVMKAMNEMSMGTVRNML